MKERVRSPEGVAVGYLCEIKRATGITLFRQLGCNLLLRRMYVSDCRRPRRNRWQLLSGIVTTCPREGPMTELTAVTQPWWPSAIPVSPVMVASSSLISFSAPSGKTSMHITNETEPAECVGIQDIRAEIDRLDKAIGACGVSRSVEPVYQDRKSVV